jgi:signal transduction histidine kinase
MPTPERAESRGRTVLPPLVGEAAAVLARPRLPADAVERLPLAREAAAARIPVLVHAPAAGGRLLLARALHALAGPEGPLVAAAGRRPTLASWPAGAALYLDVTALAPEAVLALEALLDDGLTWVVAGAEPGAPLPSALASRLDAVVLAVPPLRARAAELPALAADALARLARRAGRPAPRLTAAALALVTAHTWSGDMAELEAVLARGLLAARTDEIDIEHLGLQMGLEVEATPLPAVGAAGAAHPGPELEFLLAELAHELRNPMVTIKTYARHLPQMLEDAELRTRFAGLCDEAIERMDGLLENVLTFARLSEPHRQSVALEPLLERVLAEAQPELAGHSVWVRHAPGPPARCAADPEHVAYALRNLFAGVVREIPAREQLVLDAAANGVVTIRFAAGGQATERLRRLTAPERSPGTEGSEAATLADPTLLPLSFRLARAVLARNGGSLAVVPDPGQMTTVVVQLPTAPSVEG